MRRQCKKLNTYKLDKFIMKIIRVNFVTYIQSLLKNLPCVNKVFKGAKSYTGNNKSFAEIINKNSKFKTTMHFQNSK